MVYVGEIALGCPTCGHDPHSDVERCSIGGCGCRVGRPGDSHPMPVINDSHPVHLQVMADVEKRMQLGIKRYGTALQAFNGRNMLQDAYEEILDLAAYLKGALIEREITKARMVALVTPEACPPHPYTSRTCRLQPGHEGDHLDALGDWWTGKTSAS